MSAKSLLFVLPSTVLFFLKYQTDDVLFQVQNPMQKLSRTNQKLRQVIAPRPKFPWRVLVLNKVKDERNSSEKTVTY